MTFEERHPGLKDKFTVLIPEGRELLYSENVIDATQIDKTIVKRALSLMLKREQENCEFYRNLELCEEELGL